MYLTMDLKIRFVKEVTACLQAESVQRTIWGLLELGMLQHRLDWANTQAVSAAKVIPKHKTDLKHRNWEKADLLFKIWDDGI